MAVNSYSSLKKFEDCPRQYHEVRVLKKYPYVQTAEAEFGDRARKALELCGRDGIPLPAEFTNYQWFIDDIVRRLPGKVYFEAEFSFNEAGVPVPAHMWKQKHWMGKADVLALDGRVAYVIDIKTGKSKYPDEEQLDLMAVFTMMQHPDVEEVRGMLVFLQDGVTATRIVTKDQFMGLYQKFKRVIHDIAVAQASGVWQEKPTPLCGWCPVTDCPNWKPKPEKRS